MTTPAQHLANIDAAIDGLLSALSNDAVQEYRIGNRSYKRADFANTLKELMAARKSLQTEIKRGNRNPIRLATIVGNTNPDR